MTLQELSSSDFFFYWDTADRKQVIEADLMAMMLQPRRSLLYNREYGCGISEYEGVPNTIAIQIMLRFDIVNSFATRNSRVADGREGMPDRRALTSQSVIAIEQEGGDIDVVVNYVSYEDASNPKQLTVPWGRT